MSQTYISIELRRLVIERAGGRCEYCQIHQDDVFIPHEIDHIVAEQHGGMTTADNLALACLDCNKFKGPNIASIDPESGQLARLYNPRKDNWHEHFQKVGVVIQPLTPVGRVTNQILLLNHPRRLKLRQGIMEK